MKKVNIKIASIEGRERQKGEKIGTRPGKGEMGKQNIDVEHKAS